MEPLRTNVWGGGSVKHAGVSVCSMATAGMQPPGKAHIPKSSAVTLLGNKNTTSLDMRPHSKASMRKNTHNTP